MTQLDNGHDFLHAKKKNDIIPLESFLDNAREDIKQLLQDVSSDELISIINKGKIFSLSIIKRKKGVV